MANNFVPDIKQVRALSYALMDYIVESIMIKYIGVSSVSGQAMEHQRAG